MVRLLRAIDRWVGLIVSACVDADQEYRALEYRALEYRALEYRALECRVLEYPDDLLVDRFSVKGNTDSLLSALKRNSAVIEI